MAKCNYLHELNTPLLQLSSKSGDVWTINDAVKGAFIIGGTGSGKSSGSGRTIAHAYLKAGFGGLVLCAKPDEVDIWRKYAEETGRTNSLIVMDGTKQKRFNFIDYELARIDTGSSHTTPLALDAFMKLYEAAKLIKKSGSGGNDSFWNDSVRLLLSHSLDAVYLAYGSVKFNDLMKFIRQTPTSLKDIQNPAFQFHCDIMRIAETKVEASGDRAKIAIMTEVANWFLGFYEMDKKTRSNIIATLESMALDFTKGDLAEIFCTDTNIVPEMSHHGAVIVLDFSVKKWGDSGILAQHIFKYSWMRALERRPKKELLRPCFLWGDEYQFFISSYDTEFQSTARSAKACTVYLTQSIPALNDAVSSIKAKDTVDTLLNNFQTRIIHTCLDATTRQWAADAIGKGKVWRYTEQKSTAVNIASTENIGGSVGENNGMNSSLNSSGSGGGVVRGTNRQQQTGKGKTEGAGNTEGTSRQQVIDYYLQPSFFGENLRMGGDKWKFIVDGVVLVGGKTWEYTKKPFLITSFSQK
jgi:hypothetical protein